MIGRFIFGMVSGAILVTGGLVVSAILFPMRGTEVTEIAEVEAPVVEEPAEVPVAEPVAEPEPEPVAEPEVVIEAPAEISEEAPAVDAAADTETEVPAEVGATEVLPEAIPEAATAGATETVVTPQADEAPATDVAAEPVAEAAEIADVEPAVEAEPIVTADATAPEEPAPAASDASVSETVAEAELPAPAAEEPAPQPEPAQEPAPEPEPAQEPAPEPEPEPELVPEVAAEVPAADPPLMPGTRSKPLPGAEEPTTPDVGSLVEAAPEAALPEAGSTLEPTPGLDAMPEGVVVGRLPKIGDIPEVAAEVETPAAAPGDAPPITAFAAAFDNAGNKPVLAVVLIDNGAPDLDRAALAALPFPVSFALDPLDPATPERAAIYRTAGREVVMLATGIAYGAQASDVEVAFQSMAQGLPEAVAVMDLSTPMFQNQRPLASIVVPVVASQGRGLLTWDQGLNAADQVARREDVAAAVIFRDLASSGEDGEAIRRLLDRAVFKAGQDGSTVVAGTATPETVAALLEWSVEGRAATIALAPLTAAMKID